MMEGGEGSLGEDLRLSWLGSRIVSCLKIKSEIYTRYIASENR